MTAVKERRIEDTVDPQEWLYASYMFPHRAFEAPHNSPRFGASFHRGTLSSVALFTMYMTSA